MVAPPKPWERPGHAPATLENTSPVTPEAGPVPSSSSNTRPLSSTSLPRVPERPAILPSSITTTPYAHPVGPSTYSRFGTGYGGIGYGELGSSYTYGGYGGLGTYGGLGSYGYGSYGLGPMGMGMGGILPPNGVPSIIAGPDGQPLPTQTLESTAQYTFTVLHSIVQTCTGIAQMLESTFIATHSSFSAVVGVMDQFSQLNRTVLGSVLGLFGLLRWMKDVVTGRTTSGLGDEFRQFLNGQPIVVQGRRQPKANKKLIRLLQDRARAQAATASATGGHLRLQPGQPLPPLDSSSLTFARAVYPFTPSNPHELSLKENDIVAITGKIDPRTGGVVDPRLEVEGDEWWKGRMRDGREGWFPKKWVEILERRRKHEEVKNVD